MLKSFTKIISIAALIGLTMQGAVATVINFSTGQNSSGVIQSTGNALDANWTESGAAVPESAPHTYTVMPGNSDWYSGWFANSTTSDWIAPNPNDATGNGDYVLTFHFDLTGDNLTTASFSVLRWAIDDSGSVALNGNTLSTTASWGGFTSFIAPIADLAQGINTMTITSSNSDDVLEAARFEGMLTISPNQVPEPAGLSLIGLGLAGLIWNRRRKTTRG